MPVTKPKPPCTCGHAHHQHMTREDLGDGLEKWHMSVCQADVLLQTKDTITPSVCDCPGYQRPGSVPTRRKRGINKRAKEFEREVMDELRGVRLGGPSEPDGVTYGSDGLEFLSVECEESSRAKSPKWQRDKMQQSATHAKQRRGTPIPIFVSNEKAGRGIATEKEVHMTLHYFVKLLERLGAFGE